MQKKHIIVGSLLVIGAIMVGSSLAWWTWSTSSNEQTNVVVTVGGITIDYEDGENITNNNLIPTSTKEKGISKNITVSSTGQVYLDLNMEVVSLDDGLKDVSFVYELYKDDIFITNGNFLNSNAGDSINLLNGVKITSTPITYTLYIWIDGNFNNPSTMYNQNFEFRLNASATDEAPASMQTLQKLGLTSNGLKNFNNTVLVPTSDEGIFETPDDYGTSYYFRGAVTNNYVQFAGYYWRIIRINGNGSIRMIYDGTIAHANGESSSDRQIGTSAYSINTNDAAYVGYMYGTLGAGSYTESHANINDSVIKTMVDNWYKINIVDKGYGEKVEEDAVYCNDRSIDLKDNSPYAGPGYGKNKGVFASGRRQSDKHQTMKCPQLSQDGMSTGNASKGNMALTYPVGLITRDETRYAGSSTVNNTSYYLYTGQVYYTMTPNIFYGSYTTMTFIRELGAEGGGGVGGNTLYGVRPVISLKSSVELLGTGTMEDPFVVQ